MTDDSALPEPGVTASADHASVGAALAAARRARGLSVEDVAAATRIRATLIRAIEGDDFSHSGGLVYARGHIKSIAQVVGADGRALLAAFDHDHNDGVPPLRANPLPAFEGLSATRRPRARWPSAVIAVLAVAVVFLGVSWVIGRGQGSGGQRAGGSPVSSAASTGPGSPTGTPSPSTAPSTPPAPKGVLLRVRATAGDSWLLVTSSTGQQVYEGTLGLGQAMDFRDDRSLTIKFGNSRAVLLTLNGREVGAPRCASRVCILQFQPASQTAS